MKKILYVATVVKTHIMEFHIPYLKMMKEMGWQTAVAAKNDYDNPSDCIIPYWQRDINQIVNPCSAPDPNCQNGPIMEIRCGINSNLYPDISYVDYLKRPKIINLTWEDVQGVEDKTEECEFPDAVAYEIINIFMKLLFENAGDERLQTHFAINQTIGGLPQTESKK